MTQSATITTQEILLEIFGGSKGFATASKKARWYVIEVIAQNGDDGGHLVRLDESPDEARAQLATWVELQMIAWDWFDERVDVNREDRTALFKYLISCAIQSLFNQRMIWCIGNNNGGTYYSIPPSVIDTHRRTGGRRRSKPRSKGRTGTPSQARRRKPYPTAARIYAPR